MFVSKSLGTFRRNAFTNSNHLITEDIMISSYWEINFVCRKIPYQMQWLWEYVKKIYDTFFSSDILRSFIFRFLIFISNLYFISIPTSFYNLLFDVCVVCTKNLNILFDAN